MAMRTKPPIDLATLQAADDQTFWELAARCGYIRPRLTPIKRGSGRESGSPDTWLVTLTAPGDDHESISPPRTF